MNLADQYLELGEKIRELQKQRADIVQKMQLGRNEGTDKDVMVRFGPSYARPSVRLLRKHVPASVIERCTTVGKSIRRAAACSKSTRSKNESNRQTKD